MSFNALYSQLFLCTTLPSPKYEKNIHFTDVMSLKGILFDWTRTLLIQMSKTLILHYL